ncbi:hypothetical protein PoB_002278700 [Plakobranchus ocellatus]|uniref:Sperm protamine P1 n=1 Tax=Plakobranchus ocellatus TaxID=259542 RepID=A0AAV3ZNQ6_9GAST|nr:hypothetical protein PoB_002278700 [Plakobranchus ocellatus]
MRGRRKTSKMRGCKRRSKMRGRRKRSKMRGCKRRSKMRSRRKRSKMRGRRRSKMLNIISVTRLCKKHSALVTQDAAVKT